MVDYTKKGTIKLVLLLKKAEKAKNKDEFIEKKFSKFEKIFNKGANPLYQLLTDLSVEHDVDYSRLKFKKEFSALTWAIENNQIKLLELILNNVTQDYYAGHANLNYTNMSPLELVIKNDNIEAFKLLEKYKHDTSKVLFNLEKAYMSDGRHFVDTGYSSKRLEASPLFVASVYNSKEIAKHICENPENYYLEIPRYEDRLKVERSDRELNFGEIKDRMKEFYKEFKNSPISNEPKNDVSKTEKLENDTELSIN